MLQLDNDILKEAATDEIKQYYDENHFIGNISVDTTKGDELFNYVGYERYYGKPSYNELDDGYEKNKDDDFDLSM